MSPSHLPPLIFEKAAALEPRRSRGWLVFIVVLWSLAIVLCIAAAWRWASLHG